VRDDRIHQIKKHLSVGLAIMDVVGHVEDLSALWHRDSVAYAMHLAFQEWKAADDLLSCLAEDLQEAWCSRSHVTGPTNQGTEPPSKEPPSGMHQQ
jgi:hypothetical protein